MDLTVPVVNSHCPSRPDPGGSRASSIRPFSLKYTGVGFGVRAVRDLLKHDDFDAVHDEEESVGEFLTDLRSRRGGAGLEI